MSISEQERDMLEESFQRLPPDFNVHSIQFYEAFFERAPHLRSLFRDDLAGQGMQFMATLAELIRHIHDPGAARARYADLGRSHASLGVTVENFAPMEEALIATLASALGDRFTPELEVAWRKAYSRITEIMVREGGIS